MSKIIYRVICKGGITEFDEQEKALRYVSKQEQKGFSVRLYKCFYEDGSDLDTMICLYATENV